MRLTVNGQPHDADPGSVATVADLVRQLGLTGRPVAVEVNKELVRFRDHAATPLREGDVVEVVSLAGGG